jgi:uncharacterized RDD family membrane protein YckC
VSISAGWYPDPADPGMQRYWDGEQWVGEHLPLGAVTPDGPFAAPPVPAHSPASQPVPPPLTPAPAPVGGGGSWRGASAPLGRSGPAVPGTPYVLAPLADRLAARLIDSVVLFGLNVVVNGYFVVQLFGELAPSITAAQSGGPLVPTDRAQTLALTIQVIATALWFAYEVPSIAGTGQTLGKKLVGVRVVTLAGEPVSFVRSIQRWTVPGLPTILGLPGLLLQLADAAWCLWDRPNRQCLHDKLAGTVVVTTTSPSPPPPAGPGHP